MSTEPPDPIADLKAFQEAVKRARQMPLLPPPPIFQYEGRGLSKLADEVERSRDMRLRLYHEFSTWRPRDPILCVTDSLDAMSLSSFTLANIRRRQFLYITVDTMCEPSEPFDSAPLFWPPDATLDAWALWSCQRYRDPAPQRDWELAIYLLSIALVMLGLYILAHWQS